MTRENPEPWEFLQLFYGLVAASFSFCRRAMPGATQPFPMEPCFSKPRPISRQVERNPAQNQDFAAALPKKKIHPFFYAHSLLDEERAKLRAHGIALDLRDERCTGSPLPATSGKFLLIAELPIPFDNAGKMEGDFLCASAWLVIELNGAQHLADADAYRCD
jgi:hypothetical protein